MRKDERITWTKDDDLELVETILRNVRQGNSVIDGCREYADKSEGERSVDASKFRFHTQLKKQYETAYNLAKENGRKIKAERRKHVTQDERFNDILDNFVEKEEREVELEDVALLLKRYMKQTPKVNADELTKIQKEKEALTKQVKDLQDSNKKLHKAFNEMEHDYKAIKQALGVLKSAGLVIDVPPPTSTVKYKVGADGLVEAIE